MNNENNTEEAIVISGEENVRLTRILALRSACKLELLGMKKRGQSATAIVRQEFGFKGSKQKVLEQLNEWIAENVSL